MILDSDVIIEVLRGNQRTATWMKRQRAAGSQLRYSPVTRADIRAGSRPRERATISTLFSSLDLVPIDSSIADLAGDQLARFARTHGVQLGDALIAATALDKDEDLATFNRRHFPGVKKLTSPDR